MDLNTKNFAYMKRNVCQARARNLRLLVQPNPSSDNGNSSVRCVNVTHSILSFIPFVVVPVERCNAPTPPPPLCERADATPSAKDSKQQPLRCKSPTGMCVPLGYELRRYNSFGLSPLKIPPEVL